MNVTALFLHNMREDNYGWTIVGATNQDEIDKIDSVMEKYVDRNQISSFNEWYFRSYLKGHWYVKRFTWDNFGFTGTLDEVF